MGLTACVRPGHGGTIVMIGGDIDGGSAAIFEELVLQIMRAHGAPLLLDLSRVPFMDCAGLRALSTIRQLGEARQRQVRLIGASAAICRIASLTNTEDMLGLPVPATVQTPAPAQAPAQAQAQLPAQAPGQARVPAQAQGQVPVKAQGPSRAGVSVQGRVPPPVPGRGRKSPGTAQPLRAS